MIVVDELTEVDCKFSPLVRKRFVSFTDDTIIEDAIKSENMMELSQYLDRQSSPNSLVLKGESALHLSVKNNCVESTKLLLDQGADVNLQDEGGETALHYAIGNDSHEITDMLIDAGADLYQANDGGILPTALYKSTKMKSHLSEKMFEASAKNLSGILNRANNNLGRRRLSESDLSETVHTMKKRVRSRTLSDSNVPRKSCLKKYSAYEPRENSIKEIRESLESVFSESEPPIEKRQKISAQNQHQSIISRPPQSKSFMRRVVNRVVNLRQS